MSRPFQEPRLIDLLRDPLMEIVMARDGVSRDAIMSLLAWAARVRPEETREPRPTDR